MRRRGAGWVLPNAGHAGCTPSCQCVLCRRPRRNQRRRRLLHLGRRQRAADRLARELDEATAKVSIGPGRQGWAPCDRPVLPGAQARRRTSRRRGSAGPALRGRRLCAGRRCQRRRGCCVLSASWLRDIRGAAEADDRSLGQFLRCPLRVSAINQRHRVLHDLRLCAWVPSAVQGIPSRLGGVGQVHADQREGDFDRWNRVPTVKRRRMLEALLELRRIGAAATRQFPGSMSDRP